MRKFKILCIAVFFMFCGIILTLLIQHYTEKDLQSSYHECVPNESVAIKIGSAICEEYYNDIDWSNYYWDAVLVNYDGVVQWIVESHSEKNDKSKSLDGAGPTIYIQKKDAKVIGIWKNNG